MSLPAPFLCRTARALSSAAGAIVVVIVLFQPVLAMSQTSFPDFDTLWNYAEPATSEERFRALLPEADASGDISYRAELRTQIARAEGLQRRFDAAHRTLDTVEGLLPGASSRARVRYELERGRVRNSSGDAAGARPHFERAWELAVQDGHDVHAVDAAHMVAIVAPPDEALAWNTRAMTLAVQTQDKRTKGWIGSLTNNIGWTYHDRGEYATALEYFEQCLAWHAERKTGTGQKIAQWTVARALRSLGRTDEALERQQTLLKECEAAGGSDGYVYEEIAECLHTLGRTDEARPYFAQAYALLGRDEWLKANEPQRLERLKTMGGVQE